jgi:hypothetical protein
VTPRTVRAILAYASLAMLFAALVMLRVADLPQSVRDVVMVLIGALIALNKDAFGFFFGTSQSSQDKTDAMTAMGLEASPPRTEGETDA